MGWPQGHQVVIEEALKYIGSASRSNLNTQFSNINKSFDSPCKLSAAFPTADAKLYIQSNEIEAGNLSGMSIFPMSQAIPTVVASSIDFQAKTTSGATFVITWPSSTVGQFRRAGLSLLSNGSINVSFSPEVATEGVLANPGTLFIPAALPLGWVDLECTEASGQFKTIGSATNIIENKTSSIRIHNFVGSSSGIDADVPSTQSIASGGTITLNQLYIQKAIVSGNAAAQTTSTTPFGTSPTWPDGAEITVIGNDDTNTVTIPHNDGANGVILNGPCVLEKYMQIKFNWYSTLSRYVESGRNF